MKTDEELFQRLLGKGLPHVYFYEEETDKKVLELSEVNSKGFRKEEEKFE